MKTEPTMVDPSPYDAWSELVTVMTQVIRRGHTSAGGGKDPIDFSAFLATALAATAANVGGVDRVIAGRPGSTESDLVEQLVRGRIGYEDQDLVQHRTEQVCVPLNIDELIEESGCIPTMDDALRQVRSDFTSQEHCVNGEFTDAQWVAIESREEAVLNLYTAAYEDYARVFNDALRTTATQVEGLTVEVVMVVDTVPDPDVIVAFNPTEWDEDPLSWKLWSATLERVGTPVLSWEDPGPQD